MTGEVDRASAALPQLMVPCLQWGHQTISSTASLPVSRPGTIATADRAAFFCRWPVCPPQTMVPGMGNATRPFYLTPEAPAYAALASFYGTPVVSMRNALWRSGTPRSDGLITLNAVAKDGSTPLDAGHRSIVDMLAYYTQRTAEDLVLLPYGEYDRNSMARDLPERSVYSGELQGLAAKPALSQSIFVEIAHEPRWLLCGRIQACPAPCSSNSTAVGSTSFEVQYNLM